MAICKICEQEYDLEDRRGEPGLITLCSDCAEDDVEKLTGNMIYSHKGGASIQINRDPKLTSYINGATKLKNKGSNLGDNLRASGKMNNKTEGACLKTADAFNYKNRDT